MTKNRLRTLIKQAKSARDKAMETAALLGKPTSTGIAAGAGLGTILAAAGALSRSGEDDKDVSFLSNPLLLGTLGATGGYLAGNAFDKMPARRTHKDVSKLSLLGLLGGGGALGTMLAKEDANQLLYGLRGAKGDLLKRKGQAILPGIADKFNDIVTHHRLRKGLKDGIMEFETALPTKVLNKFNDAQKEYTTALRRAGLYDDAKRLGGFVPDKNWVMRMFDKAINHPVSPISWLRSTYNLAKRKTLLKALVGKGIKLKNGVQMGGMLRRTPARLAALALLAGGGKAIYDKVHD